VCDPQGAIIIPSVEQEKHSRSWKKSASRLGCWLNQVLDLLQSTALCGDLQRKKSLEI
jgi:hypothetical protein